MGTFKAIGQVKGWIRRCAAGLYALSPRYLEPLRGKVIILTYHRVVSKKELDAEYIQPGMYVTVETFAMQMRFITQYFSVTSYAVFCLKKKTPPHPSSWSPTCPSRARSWVQ